MSRGASLPADIERLLAESARAWPALEVLMVFGSAAQGRLQPGSDLDLYVRLQRSAQRDRVAEAPSQR